MTHEQLIAAVTQWFWNNHPEERGMLYAINNNISEGLLSYVPKYLRSHAARIEGNKNKAKGVVPGVLDLCYITYEGKPVYLDAKVGNDKLSDEQKDFCEKLTDRGILWFVFSSVDEFKNIINTIQNG